MAKNKASSTVKIVNTSEQAFVRYSFRGFGETHFTGPFKSDLQAEAALVAIISRSDVHNAKVVKK